MFGYVVARKEGLNEEEYARYRALYCGLCRDLGERCGQMARLCVNYDMVFLVLVLSSLYEPEETAGSARCAAHPARARDFVRSEVTAYAADMNVALMYHKLRDDWADEGDPLRRGSAALLKKPYEQVRLRWPRQCREIEEALEELHALEQARDPVPDRAAACSGKMMAAAFHWKDDRWTPVVRDMAFALGELVYLEDACVDLKKDGKKNRYNPLLALWGGERPLESYEPMLLMLAGQCAQALDRLPLVQDAGILREIVYSGVWSRYHQARAREEQKKNKAGERN